MNPVRPTAREPVARKMLKLSDAYARRSRSMSRDEMKNRTTQIIYAYWNEVRHGRLAPRRFDIEPARIAGILAETMILECGEDGAVRFRLAGTRITESFGTELRGQSFLDLWSEPQREALIRQLDTLKNEGGALLLEIDAATASDRTVVMEAILLPLIHTRDVVDRFLGSISCTHAPFWLGSEPLTRLAIRSSEIVWPEGRPHRFAEKLAHPPALSSFRDGSRIVHLDQRRFRIFDGGRKLS